MKVVDVRTTIVTVPLTEPETWQYGQLWGLTNAIVEVETDDGIVGIGEAPGSPSIGVVIAAIEELAGLLSGADPRDIATFLGRCRASGSGHYGTTLNTAVGALEVALWDVLGRSLDVPVSRLFGGLASREIPFWWYVTAMDRTEDEVRRQAAEGVRRGFETMYLKIGFDHESDLALTSAIRDEVGPAVVVRVDVNEGWTVAEALSLLPAYGGLGVDFVEEPIDSDNLDGMASLRSRTRIPIGANQSAWLSRDAWRVIRMQAADVIVSDHHQVGGLQAFRDLAAVCRAAGLPLVRHAFGDLGVTTAAGLHVLGTMPSPQLAHQQYLQLAEHQLLAEPLVFEHGNLHVPTGPGLGVELDRDALEHYAELYRRFGETAQYGHGPFNQIPPEHTLGTAQALM